MTRRCVRRFALVLLAAMAASACSGGDSGEPAPEVAEEVEPTAQPADDGPDVTTGDGEGATPDPLAPIPATGDELFPCTLGELPSDPTLTVAYGQAGDRPTLDLGPNADRFRALMDDYGSRCGGAVEVRTFNLADPGACDDIAALAPALTITDAGPLDVVRCIASRSSAPLWHEAGIPTAIVPELDGRVNSTQPPGDVAAVAAVAAAQAEGVLSDPVTVLHQDDEVATAIANAVTAGVPGSSAVVIDDPDCASAPVGAQADGIVVVVDSPCLARLAQALGGASRWVVIDHADALADPILDGTADVSESLDGASAYTAFPYASAGWAFDLDPASRDRACVRYLDAIVGTDTAYPSASFAAATRLCATAHAVVQTITATASDSPDDLMAAAAGVADVPLPRGLQGSMSAGEPWVAESDQWVLEFRAGCACWTQVAGPIAPGS